MIAFECADAWPHSNRFAVELPQRDSTAGGDYFTTDRTLHSTGVLAAAAATSYGPGEIAMAAA